MNMVTATAKAERSSSIRHSKGIHTVPCISKTASQYFLVFDCCVNADMNDWNRNVQLGIKQPIYMWWCWYQVTSCCLVL